MQFCSYLDEGQEILVASDFYETSLIRSGFSEMLNSHSLRCSKLDRQKLYLFLSVSVKTTGDLLIYFQWNRIQMSVASVMQAFSLKPTFECFDILAMDSWILIVGRGGKKNKIAIF